jgi:CheY-like chemotaxis protein
LRQIPQFKNTIIFAVSASVFGQDQDASIDVGCNAFIPKPVREETLLEHIKTFLGLEWEYTPDQTEMPLAIDRDLEKSNTQTSTPSRDRPKDRASIIPDPEILNNLLQLAMMGDAIALEEQAIQIEQQDDRFIKFTGEIRQLAKGFQIKQIQALLKSYLNPHL